MLHVQNMLYKDKVGCILKLIVDLKYFFLSHSDVIGQPLIIELNNVVLDKKIFKVFILKINF